VNYDLPWNPMEVEQRIGRIDRIGQKSRAINIINLWVEGTVEERILRRLYERIGIFESAIGGLDAVLGEIALRLERDVLRADLTPEEEREYLEQAKLSLARRDQDLKSLEENSARFVGIDGYFMDQIEKIRTRKRFVTEEQMRLFLITFLQEFCPNSRLECGPDQTEGTLYPDRTLEGIITEHNKMSELGHLFGARQRGISITLNSEVAFREPQREFITAIHPLIQTMVRHYKRVQSERPFPTAHLVQIDQSRLGTFYNSLERGNYFYFVNRISVSALRKGATLQIVFLDKSFAEVGDNEQMEELLATVLEHGTATIRDIDICFSHDERRRASKAARSIFIKRTAEEKERVLRTNGRLVDLREKSLQQHHEKRINATRERLDKEMDGKRREKYLNLMQSQLAKREAEWEKQREILKAARVVSAESEQLAAGIICVV